MTLRRLASVFPRQSPSSLIFSSINAEADSTGTGLFIYTSNSRYFSCAQRNLHPPQVEASSGSIAVRKDGRNPRAGLIGMIEIMLNALLPQIQGQRQREDRSHRTSAKVRYAKSRLTDNAAAGNA